MIKASMLESEGDLSVRGTDPSNGDVGFEGSPRCLRYVHQQDSIL